MGLWHNFCDEFYNSYKIVGWLLYDSKVYMIFFHHQMKERGTPNEFIRGQTALKDLWYW